MARYIVKRFFVDLQDGRRTYTPGDIYPREGLTPSEERIQELAGPNNRLGQPLIEVAPETVNKKTAGNRKATGRRTAKKVA